MILIKTSHYKLIYDTICVIVDGVSFKMFMREKFITQKDYIPARPFRKEEGGEDSGAPKGSKSEKLTQIVAEVDVEVAKGVVLRATVYLGLEALNLCLFKENCIAENEKVEKGLSVEDSLSNNVDLSPYALIASHDHRGSHEECNSASANLFDTSFVGGTTFRKRCFIASGGPVEEKDSSIGLMSFDSAYRK